MATSAGKTGEREGRGGKFLLLHFLALRMMRRRVLGERVFERVLIGPVWWSRLLISPAHSSARVVLVMVRVVRV